MFRHQHLGLKEDRLPRLFHTQLSQGGLRDPELREAMAATNEVVRGQRFQSNFGHDLGVGGADKGGETRHHVVRQALALKDTEAAEQLRRAAEDASKQRATDLETLNAATAEKLREAKAQAEALVQGVISTGT